MKKDPSLGVAALQMADQGSPATNRSRVEELLRTAAQEGAQVILPPELFDYPYFCQEEDPRYFEWARAREAHEGIARFRELARELGVVIPYSFFEKAGQAHFNSVAMIDADGSVLGVYRKSHLPDGPGYEEKFYFNPGDTGFRVWSTAHGHIGVGICWDQWFPEAARAMVLQGADLLLYPTAIGSEPEEPDFDSQPYWQRVMQGHAGANVVPLVAANRYGTEASTQRQIDFFGSSFICNQWGEKVAEAGRSEDAVLTATFDLHRIRQDRANWGFFRDRRPEHYRSLLGLDGSG